MIHLEGHCCPKPCRGTLPLKISQDAVAGKFQSVCDWIDRGGNVNAGDHMDRTLLHVACQGQNVQMVRKLLEHPDIHLNTRMNTKPFQTPLGIAALTEELEILELLLKAKTDKCVINLDIPVEKNDRGIGMAAIIFAAQMKKWESVRLMLKYHDNMTEREAFQLLSKAIDEYEYGIAMEIIQWDCPFRDNDFRILVENVYQNKNCTLADAIFRKNILTGNDSSITFFYLLSCRKDWSNLETYLRLLNGEAKIHVGMVEAILARKKGEVEGILKEVKGDPEIMAGTLLAASIGGTSDEVAELLLKCESVEYSDRTLSNALLLGSSNQRIEFIQHLLLMKKFTLNILSRSHDVSTTHANNIEISSLLNTILEERHKELSIAQKVVDTEDKTDKEGK